MNHRIISIIVCISSLLLLICSCTANHESIDSSKIPTDTTVGVGETTPITVPPEPPHPVTPLVDNTDDEAQLEVMDLDSAYTVTQLENPDSYFLAMSIATKFYIDGDSFCVWTGNFMATGKTGSTVLRYDKTGRCLSETKIPYKSGDFPIIYERPLSNGTFLYYTATDFNYIATQILIGDADGNILYQTPLSTYPDSIHGHESAKKFDLHIDERTDGTVRIFVNAWDKLYYLDEKLNILNTVAITAEYYETYQESDGVYILGRTQPGMARVNMETGELTAIDRLPVPDGLPDNTVYSFGADGALYYNDRKSLYRAVGDGTAEKLFSWADGRYSGDGLFWVLDETSVFYIQYAQRHEEHNLYPLVVLSPNTGEAKDTRRVINCASFLQSDDWMDEAVTLFNARNPDYVLRITDLNADLADGETAVDRLSDMLIRGNIPDMVLFNADYQTKNFTDKGLFVDLAPHYGEALLGYAASAYTDAYGYQYMLPLSIPEVSLYAAAADVCDTPLTWEKLYALRRDIDSGNIATRAITSYLQPAQMRAAILREFVDIRAAKAYFDTDAFRERIRFAEALETQYTDSAYGYMSYGAQTNLDYGIVENTAVIDAVKTGEVAFLHVPFHSLDGYGALKMIFEDTPFTLCGNPTENGNAPHVRVSAATPRLALFAESDTLGGCKVFIDFMLSDELQSSPFMTDTALPVTRTGLEKALENYRYIYYPNPLITHDEDIFGQPCFSLFLADTGHGAAQDSGALLRGAREIVLSDADIEALVQFFVSCTADSGIDSAIYSIAEEELSAYESGAKTLEEVTKLMQSRVSIYLNE